MVLEQLQCFASTRVRKDGQCTDRTTGNLIAVSSRHETSRPLDPHNLYCNSAVAHVCKYTLRHCEWAELVSGLVLVLEYACTSSHLNFVQRSNGLPRHMTHISMD